MKKEDYEAKTGGLEKRRLRVLDTVYMTNGTERPRSFGFHHRQKARPPKQEMPARETA